MLCPYCRRQVKTKKEIYKGATKYDYAKIERIGYCNHCGKTIRKTGYLRPGVVLKSL